MVGRNGISFTNSSGRYYKGKRRGGNYREPQLLANAYRNSPQLAVDHGIRSLAFPSISTGVYSYPVDQAALIAVKTVKDFYAEHKQ